MSICESEPASFCSGDVPVFQEVVQMPVVRIELPTFEPHIFSDSDYASFLKNPKYKSGTVFVDPDGVRRVKP